ncbi:MAG: hypothetical protein ACOYOV_00115 [Bacteroidales bacterium]
MLDRRIFVWKRIAGEWRSVTVQKLEAGDKILGFDFDKHENTTLTVRSAIPMVAPYTQIFLSNGQIFSLARTASILTADGYVEPVKGTKIIHARYTPSVNMVKHNLLGYNFVDLLLDKDYPVVVSNGYYFRARS